MLSKVLIAVALSTASLLSLAEPIVIPPKTNFNVPEVQKHCKEGCVVLSAEDIQRLVQSISQIANDAYSKGIAEGKRVEKSTI